MPPAKRSHKKKAEAPAPPKHVLRVRPRSAPTGHPIAISWRGLDAIHVDGPTQTRVALPVSGPDGSMTWTAAHAGRYVFKGTAEGATVAEARVLIR